MAHSSWGPGWPNCQGNSIVPLNVDGINFPAGVRAELHELVTRLVRETRNRGYVFGVEGDPSYGCWGYNCRAISGTNNPSNHSWGLAVDINAPRNPYKAPLTTDMPGWMPDLWNAYGFRWGGDYTSSKKDAMHYEFMGSVSDADNYTNIARSYRLGESVIDEENDPVTTEQLDRLLSAGVTGGRIGVCTAYGQQHVFTVDPHGRLVHYFYNVNAWASEVLADGLDPDGGVAVCPDVGADLLQAWCRRSDGTVVIAQYGRPGPWAVNPIPPPPL